MAAGAVAEKAIDIAADVAEEVAEESADIAVAARAMDPRNLGFLFGGAGIGVAVGAASAYLILNKRLRLKYEAIADEEIGTMRDQYRKKILAMENEQEKTVLDQVATEIKTRTDGGRDGGGVTPYHQMYQGSEPDKTLDETKYDDDQPTAVQNVFVNGEDPEPLMEDGWDYNEEIQKRSPGAPYIIHRDEFNEPNGDEWEQYTLTYFEGDDTLCRDDDTIIPDKDETVGVANLSRFGHGSGDPNIVYIRNEELKVDLEVSHSDGKYAVDVAGFKEDELQHSSMRRRSPRRSEYDPDR